MNYTLQRYEKYRDKDGNITSIFIAVRVTDGEDSITQKYHLNQDEIALVLEDESTLTLVLEEVAAKGAIRLEDWITNKPQPPIIADAELRKGFFPNPTKAAIDKKVAELKIN